MKEDRQRFAHLVGIYFDTRRNKRYGRDAMAYEMSWVSNLVRDFREREDRSLRVRHNTAFLTPTPRWREIMATEMTGRILDHEICEEVIPLAEQVLSPYTFNNREGKGAMAAMNLLIDNICKASNGYTEPCRIIKLDLKGYFPNAVWRMAEDCINRVIDLSGREDADYLRWLTMIAINGNPAAHCVKKSPLYLWREHIDPGKSILTKPEGVGAAIGRLIWQTAMGLYINDEIVWLSETCGLLVVCFVDDIALAVPERLHGYALSLIPELRRRFAAKGVTINERKFYDQPFYHGVEFLGSHIRPYRVLLNDKTWERAVERVWDLNAIAAKEANLDRMVSSANAYTGMLKIRTEYRRTCLLRDMILKEWSDHVSWDARRQCVVCKPGLAWRDRMNHKYHLKLKRS